MAPPSITQFLYTEVPGTIFRTAMHNAMLELEIARDYIHKVDDLSKSDSVTLLEIQKIAPNIRAAVDDQLMETEVNQL